MKASGCCALLVVDEGKAVGTVTERDLVGALADRMDANAPIERIMDRNVITMPADYRLADIIGKADFRDLSRIVILNERRQPVGLFAPEEIFSLLSSELSLLARAPFQAAWEETVDDIAA